MSKHSCVPRIITEAPWDGLMLDQCIPSLLADSNTNNCQVSNIYHYKETAQPWHEYVVATIVVTCTLAEDTRCAPQRDYLKIERIARKGYLTSTPSHDLLSICRTNSMGFTNLDPCELIKSIDLPEPGFPLREFLVLLRVVPNARAYYLEWKYQSYWFSWVIMQAVAKYRSVTPTDGPAIDKRGRWGKSGGSVFGEDTRNLAEILKRFRDEVNLPVIQVVMDQGHSGEHPEYSRMAAEIEELKRDRDA
jgi:hypothetical protein